MSKRRVHQGKNIQKFRLIRDKSHVDIAVALEEILKNLVSQQFVSDLENKEVIDDEVVLKQIAEILKVDKEAIKHLDWDAAITVTGSSFTTNDQAPAINQPIQSTINQTFNPLDKLIEMFEKEKAELKAEIEKLKRINR